MSPFVAKKLEKVLKGCPIGCVLDIMEEKGVGDHLKVNSTRLKRPNPCFLIFWSDLGDL